MSEKNVFVSIPVSVAVDAVQIRLQSIGSELELLGQSHETPTYEALQELCNELLSISYVIKTVEENAQ